MIENRKGVYRVGLAGPIGSGKSYLGNALENTLLYAQVIPFAKALKELCNAQNYGYWYPAIEEWGRKYNQVIPHDTILEIGDAFRQYPSKPGVKNRKLLQYVGTEIMRAWNPNIWIECIEYQIKPSTKYVIHDDLRFANEAATLHYVVEIVDPNAAKDEHASEQRQWVKAYPVPDWRLEKGFTVDDVSKIAIQIISRAM